MSINYNRLQESDVALYSPKSRLGKSFKVFKVFKTLKRVSEGDSNNL